MTVPKSPVTALKGISESVIDLDRTSTNIIKVPPKVIHRGIVLFASLPASNLTICGITNPIQDMVPQKHTEIAVRIVDITIINPR